MHFVFAGYIRTASFHTPEEWLFRLRAYTGVLEALAKKHAVTSIEQIAYEGIHHYNGVQYHFADYGKPVLHFPLKLHRLIRSLRPDVVVIHGSCFPWQVWQLRKMLGAGVHIAVQDHSHAPPSGYRKILQRIADHSIDKYFFTSADMAAPWLSRKLIAHAGKIREVPVGSSVFQPVPKAAARAVTGMQGDPAFVWVGRLDHNKDPLTVVKAFLVLCSHYPHARLYMIYTSGELWPEINRLLHEHPFGHAVIPVGQVSHDIMQYWFSSADIMVATSRHEVFGAAVVEAISCGCIPVLSNIPSFRKITGNGTCGFLYPAGDVMLLSEKMLQAASCNRETAYRNALSWFRDQLSFEAIARSVEAALL